MRSFGKVVFVFIAIAGSASAVMAQDPHITIQLTQNDHEVNDVTVVRGIVTAQVTVQNATGMAVQAFVNWFGYVDVHSLTTSSWTHTFSFDTSTLFDGEQLFIVYVNGRSNPEEPIDTLSLQFATQKFLTHNGRPAPKGDYYLPQINIGKVEIHDTHPGPTLTLKGGMTDDTKGLPGQVLVRANTSYLSYSSTCIGGDPGYGSCWVEDLATHISLLPFQRREPTRIKLVVVARDAAGRANIKDTFVDIPAKDPEDARLFPLPLPEVRILNVEEFTELNVGIKSFDPWTIIHPFKVQVEVSNYVPDAPYGIQSVALWIGPWRVSDISLWTRSERRQRFVVELEIYPLTIMNVLRATEPATLSAPLWVEFGSYPGGHIPSRQHVHLNSVVSR